MPPDAVAVAVPFAWPQKAEVEETVTLICPIDDSENIIRRKMINFFIVLGFLVDESFN